MKLNRMMSGACAALAVASLLGCSSTSPRAPKTAQSDAALDERGASTELMSAQLAAPAPKVGKSHLFVDDEETPSVAPRSNELGAPKDGRPSDGSRCSGHFGSTK